MYVFNHFFGWNRGNYIPSQKEKTSTIIGAHAMWEHQSIDGLRMLSAQYECMNDAQLSINRPLPLLALFPWKHVHASSITATSAYKLSHWTTLQIGYETPLFVQMIMLGLYIILSKSLYVWFTKSVFPYSESFICRSQGSTISNVLASLFQKKEERKGW